mmetsp:Transcript_11184/g.36822  ORF Transcript_11184/g.36822 Transcript_11184/m.36822 type:complete len:332 (-) Transcript_11184:8-1003(-)
MRALRVRVRDSLSLLRASALHEVIERVVTEAHVILVVVVILGEGILGAEERESRRHSRVLHFDREVARGGAPCLGKLGGGARLEVTNAEVLNDLVGPLNAIHLALLGRGVGHDGEGVLARGEDHLADVARATLRLLIVRVKLLVHRVHRNLEELEVTVRLLHRGAEKLKATHGRCARNLHALLATLLDHRLQLLLRLLLLLLRLNLLWRLGRRGRRSLLLRLLLLAAPLLLLLLLAAALAAALATAAARHSHARSRPREHRPNERLDVVVPPRNVRVRLGVRGRAESEVHRQVIHRRLVPGEVRAREQEGVELSEAIRRAGVVRLRHGSSV